MDDVKAVENAIRKEFCNGIGFVADGGGHRIETGFRLQDGSSVNIRLEDSGGSWVFTDGRGIRIPVGDRPGESFRTMVETVLRASATEPSEHPRRDGASGNDEEGILEAVTSRFGGLADIVRRDGECLIVTGFTFSDGDGITVRLTEEDEGWVFTDDGSTVGWLMNHLFSYTDARRSILERTAESGGGWLDGGSIKIDAGKRPDFSLTCMIGIMLRASELLCLSRRNVRNTFAEDLRRIFSDGCWNCEFDRIVTSGRGEEFRADVYVDGPRPTAVFGVRTRGRCKDTAVAVMALSEEPGMDTMVVVSGDCDAADRDMRLLRGRAGAVLSLDEVRNLAASGGLLPRSLRGRHCAPRPEGIRLICLDMISNRYHEILFQLRCLQRGRGGLLRRLRIPPRRGCRERTD